MDELRVAPRRRPPGVERKAFVQDELSGHDERVAVDVVDPEQRLVRLLRGTQPPVPRADVICWTVDRRAVDPAPGYVVEQRLCWDDGLDRSHAGPTPGVKQLSFVRRPAGLAPDDFATRYRAHADVARQHHAGVARYVQSTVLRCDSSSLPPLDAVSELWFATEDDYVQRYYATPASQAEVRADTERFVDFTTTWSVVAVEHVITPQAARR